jgi:hypothetical protein
MFLRVNAIKEVGLFDERFFLYAEDIDFTRRMHEKYDTLFYPKVSVYHTFTRGSRKEFKLMIIHIISIIKYFNKWGWWRDAERKHLNNDVMKQIGGKVNN